MTIQIDSHEKARAITKIIDTFDKNNVKYFVSKLYVGDYMSFDNPRLIVDRKQNLNEVCGNVCQDHKRFVNVLNRANELGVELVFLVEHSRNIKVLEDVQHWVNPRLKTSPMAVSGDRLYKILSTMEKTYGTKFLFCDKQQTGKRIISILNGSEQIERDDIVHKITV